MTLGSAILYSLPSPYGQSPLLDQPGSDHESFPATRWECGQVPSALEADAPKLPSTS